MYKYVPFSLFTELAPLGRFGLVVAMSVLILSPPHAIVPVEQRMSQGTKPCGINTLKKCRSLSISNGKAKDVPFHIGDFRIPSICDKDQKFLGKLLFFSGKSEDVFSLKKDTFVEAIDNIEKALVRDEYKLWIYSEYLPPSK